jgi:phosphatidylserine/phosphatidylglycerophosphate/cardiolipin synthase-like enzyme
MKLRHLTLALALVTNSSWGSVKAYFNHNPKSSYTEPYRNVTREGDNLENVLLENISKAKKSIFIAVQELRLPLVAQALVNKKKDGLDVRVVLEHNYNFTVIAQRDPEVGQYEATKLLELTALIDINGDGKFSKTELEARDAVYMLEAGKVPVMDDTFDNSNGSGLMHHKFMIVDGKTVVVSSANFTLSCIHGDILAPQSRGNANSMVVIQNQSVGDIFEEEFSQLWGNGKRGNFGHNKTYRGPQVIKDKSALITIQFSPTSARYNWEESVNGLIASYVAKAKSSVKAALFVYSDQKLSDAFEKRHIAGVDMGFIVEPKFAFREYSELLDMAGLEMLSPKCTYEPDNRPWKKSTAEIGIPNLNRGDVLHHKFGVVDSKFVIIGSQNWSEAANYVNDETLIVIESAEISDQYTQEYERLKAKSSMGVPAYLKKEIKRLETDCAERGLYF